MDMYLCSVGIAFGHWPGTVNVTSVKEKKKHHLRLWAALCFLCRPSVCQCVSCLHTRFHSHILNVANQHQTLRQKSWTTTPWPTTHIHLHSLLFVSDTCPVPVSPFGSWGLHARVMKALFQNAALSDSACTLTTWLLSVVNSMEHSVCSAMTTSLVRETVWLSGQNRCEGQVHFNLPTHKSESVLW